MKRTLLHAALLAAMLPAFGAVAYAADQDQDRLRDQDRLQTPDQTRDQDRLRTRDQDQVYGSQLMTQEERNAYRERMRAASRFQRIRQNFALAPTCSQRGALGRAPNGRWETTT